MAQELPTGGTRLRDLAKMFAENKDPFDLREEIGMTRAAISEIFDSMGEGDHELLRASTALNALLNTTGRLVQRLHEIEVGRRYVVQVDVVHQLLSQVLAIVVEHVPDAKTRAQIAEGIEALEVLPESGKPRATTALTVRDEEIINHIS